VIDFDRIVTEKVRTELIGRGKYTVVPETTGVDGILTGEIVSLTTAPAAFTDQRQASRYVFTLTAKIEFKDVKADKVIWSNPAMQFREEADVTTSNGILDPNTFFGQDINARDRLASEFARSVISAILEAFEVPGSRVEQQFRQWRTRVPRPSESRSPLASRMRSTFWSVTTRSRRRGWRRSCRGSSRTSCGRSTSNACMRATRASPQPR